MLCSLKRSQNDLSGYQEKIFKVDSNVGMAMSGLTADASNLYLQTKKILNKKLFKQD